VLGIGEMTGQQLQHLRAARSVLSTHVLGMRCGGSLSLHERAEPGCGQALSPIGARLLLRRQPMHACSKLWGARGRAGGARGRGAARRPGRAGELLEPAWRARKVVLLGDTCNSQAIAGARRACRLEITYPILTLAHMLVDMCNLQALAGARWAGRPRRARAPLAWLGLAAARPPLHACRMPGVLRRMLARCSTQCGPCNCAAPLAVAERRPWSTSATSCAATDIIFVQLALALLWPGIVPEAGKGRRLAALALAGKE